MASVLPNKNEEKLLKIKQKLIEISSLSNDEIFVKFNSSKRGITDEEIIEQNQDEFGKNQISKKGADNVWKRIVRSFFNLFNIILFILSMISMIVEVIIPLSKGEKPSYITMTIILVMVFLSSIIHFIQEQRSATSASKLTQIIQTTSLIERNGI